MAKAKAGGVQPHDLLGRQDAARLKALVAALDAGLLAHAAGGNTPGNWAPYRHGVADVVRAGFQRHDLLAAVQSRYAAWDVSWALPPAEDVLAFRVRGQR